ncbi:CAP domain-containing protein [Aciduricibacillus chroicocephali]|uniref:CAP domain-containing protein n=1 Tax=Aciduricibacillus chroicocephali TaxID=3054939 RepID=A0ABY9KY23_9BACI|nr:CAP domain-containing protein [Bacillaceae bacterium 44XB]
MRKIRNLLLIFLVIFAAYSILTSNNAEKKETMNRAEKIITNTNSEKNLQTGAGTIPLKGDLYKWIGKKDSDLLKAYGKPLRKDLSAYGYKWWVYKNKNNSYIQFGVENGVVQTLYAIGKGIGMDPVKYGDSYSEANSKLHFKKRVTYEKGMSSYTFRLKDKDMKMWPLMKINDSLFAQYYFDTFTDQLSAVRVMNANVLLKQRPYEVEYRGNLPERPELTEVDWEKAESGMEKQILDITNVMRQSHGKRVLKPDTKTAEVAYLHSKDMSDNNYFSHYGLDGTGLKERLAEKHLTYISAGENIAAQYPDAAAAMEGWLNSKGHREALLHNGYTHLGAGVYKYYYTQNFLQKP